MFRSILPTPSYDHLFSVDPPEGGDGGNGGGGNGGGGGDDKDKGLSQAEVDRIVQGRVEQTRKATTEEIAKQLGVSVDEAKQIIEDAKKKADDEKTDAQKAREAADAEKSKSEAATAAAAKDRHDTRIERQLLRALPKDLDDDALDKRVTKLARLLDVEVGADDATIKAGIDDLRKDMPELFPEDGSNGKKKKAPDSDPKGKPPAGGSKNEDAFTRGQERAKAAGSGAQYAILEKS